MDDMAEAKNQIDEAMADQSDVGLVREIWEFLRVTKKWWLLPIILVLGLLGLLVVLSGTAAAPFIYTLF